MTRLLSLVLKAAGNSEERWTSCVCVCGGGGQHVTMALEPTEGSGQGSCILRTDLRDTRCPRAGMQRVTLPLSGPAADDMM